MIAMLSVVTFGCGSFGESKDDVSLVEAGRSSGGDSPHADGGVDSASPDATPTGATPASTCPGAANCERVVFVTGFQYFVGSIGGLAGADAQCNVNASIGENSRVNGREFVAWLSDDTSSPNTRMVHGTGKYVRPDGMVIAENFAALTSGADLENPISLDEDGDPHGGAVWTGTGPLGTPMGGNCNAWTMASPTLANHGDASSVSAWTTTVNDPQDVAICGTNKARIYCVEK